MRLIDADKLKEIISEKIPRKFGRWDRMIPVCEWETFIRDIIDNAPTVIIDWEKSDAYLDCVKRIKSLEKENDELRQFLKAYFERPQGEWIIVKDEKYGDNVKCPFCSKELAGTDLNFCCKCGADMRGRAE